jgi:GntR family transcriptional repressor for pyruvate dehydrogenase complex
MTLRAVTEVQGDLHDMLTAIPVLDVNIAHSNSQHRALLRAILRGDPTRARRVMESHCDDTAALLRGLLA